MQILYDYKELFDYDENLAKWYMNISLDVLRKSGLMSLLVKNIQTAAMFVPLNDENGKAVILVNKTSF